MLAARHFGFYNAAADLEVLFLVFRDLNIQLTAAQYLHVIDADNGQFVVLGKKIAERFEIGNYQVGRKLVVDLAVFGKIFFQFLGRGFQRSGKSFCLRNHSIFISQVETADLVHPVRKVVVKHGKGPRTGNYLHIVVLFQQIPDNNLAAGGVAKSFAGNTV